MARVLCAWELGSGLGHVGRLIPIARELRELGHEVVMMLRDSAYIHLVRSEGFETLAAPLLQQPREANPSPLNPSDILLNLGYDDARSLHGALRAWHSTLALVAPDIVVADYAPTALVAAGMARIPRATVGSGFALPPPGDPIPALRPWAGADPHVLKALDDRLVARLRAAAGAATAVPATARAFFDAEAHLLCTFPEIDPFGPRPDVDYLGPPANVNRGLDVAWETEGRARVLAYLKPGAPHVEAAMASLAEVDAEVIVAFPGAEASRAKELSRGTMRVFARPVEVAPLMAGASLAVFHAGSGFAAQALVAGVPMAMLPLHVEQFLIARRVVQAGMGELASTEHPVGDLREWFTRLIGSVPMHEAARQASRPYGDYSFAAAARRAAERVASMA